MELAAFLDGIRAIEAARPSYRLGHSGDDGFCDCIGLIIGAIQRGGGSWNGIHGSNWAARHAVVGLERIGDGNLKVGDLVFKGGGGGLPGRYADDPDQTDYYHVGAVISVDPLDIIHCTRRGDENGVVHDYRIGRWNYRGWLEQIPLNQRGGGQFAASGALNGADDQASAEPSETRPAASQAGAEVFQPAVVVAENGSTVKLRAEPSRRCRLYWNIPVGSPVEAGNDRANGWTPVRYCGHKGYMMSKFLERG